MYMTSHPFVYFLYPSSPLPFPTHTAPSHPHSPGLPDNIIELGHPGSTPRLLDPVQPEEEEQETGNGGMPTLDPNTLEDLWKEYIDISKRSARSESIECDDSNVYL